MPAKIDSITEKNQVDRDRLWEQVTQYLNEIHLEEDSVQKKDAMDDMTTHVLALSILQTYLNARTNRETSLGLTDWIREHDVIQLKKSYTPGFKQIAPLAVQGAAVTISFLFAIAVPGAGLTGSQAQICNAISQGGQGGAQLASGVGQLTNTYQQGQQANQNAILQASQRILQDRDQTYNRHQQAAQQHLEQAKHQTQIRHDTLKTMTS